MLFHAMESFTWKELAHADAVATSKTIDNPKVISHKVILAHSGDHVNEKLIDCLCEMYRKSCEDFVFAPVEYLPPQRYTNLGVFAGSDIETGSPIQLFGFLAKLPKTHDMPEDANVSVFKRKGEELMLGPLSFVNHSCLPNAVYVIDQGWHMFLNVSNFLKRCPHDILVATDTETSDVLVFF